MRVLIIEVKHEVAANIGDYPEACGHQPDFAYDGLGGLHLAVTKEYDAMVLDIGLPGLDGLSLCRRLREDARSSTPILMLTARDTLDDKLAGFDLGADDYLVKPFALKELVARLNALAQRGRRSAAALLSIADQYSLPWMGGVFEKPEEEIAADLESLSGFLDSQTVLVTRSPAYGVLDPGPGPHKIGSRSLRDVLSGKKVLVHVHGHSHSGVGRSGYHFNVASALNRRAMLTI